MVEKPPRQEPKAPEPPTEERPVPTDGLLAPLVPSLSPRIEVNERRRPTYLNVYRGSWNKRVWKAKMPLRTTVQMILDQADHGEGGHYFLVVHDQDDSIWPCQAGEVDLEPDPVRYADYKLKEQEMVQRINAGHPLGESVMRDENRVLRDRIDELERRLSSPGGQQVTSQGDPEIKALLAGLSQAVTAMLNRPAAPQMGLSEMVTAVSQLNNLAHPPQAAPPQGNTLRDLIEAYKAVHETVAPSTALAKPDPAGQLATKLDAMSRFIDRLAPKAAGLVSVIGDEIRREPGTPPGSGGGNSNNGAGGNGEKKMDWTPFKDELEGKLRNQTIPPEQIAADFKSAIEAGRLPRYIKAMLVMVDAGNLDDTLQGLERPLWGQEPIRSRFLRTLDLVRRG